MASKSKSRWADSEEDAALEARLKKEKEEKKRLKAEKARKEAEEKARLAASQHKGDDDTREDEHNGRPAKRRKLTPERGDGAPTAAADDDPTGNSEGSTKLLRFTSETIGSCRSVELYDKLNDIEEGAYGWVSRAKEIATGRVVALKRLKIDPKDRGGLPITGLREIQLLKDCRHRNVLNLQEVVVGDDTSRIER